MHQLGFHEHQSCMHQLGLTNNEMELGFTNNKMELGFTSTNLGFVGYDVC